MIVVNLDVMLAKRKMSVTELSERVGITMANISILKNGRAKAVKLSTLEKICAALDCQPGDLLEWRAEAGSEAGLCGGSAAAGLPVQKHNCAAWAPAGLCGALGACADGSRGGVRAVSFRLLFERARQKDCVRGGTACLAAAASGAGGVVPRNGLLYLHIARWFAPGAGRRSRFVVLHGGASQRAVSGAAARGICSA